VPAYRSPFKLRAADPGAQDRLDMLAASLAADPRFTFDDCEIKRKGVSYTVDTIGEIVERYRPEGKPGLVIGDDLASTFLNWKDAARIADEADIIVARRLFDPSLPPADFPFPCKTLDNELMNISSQLVRERIASGGNWRPLVPQGARWIIEDRKLYQGASKDAPAEAEGITLELVAEVENEVRRTVKPSRFLHSRNTAIMAYDLCVRFGLPPLSGYLAGIAHDMAKYGHPGLDHGRAAAAILKKKYGVADKDILDAVASHVTGRPGMKALAKIVYIADKIEFSRDWVEPRLRAMAESAPLDELFRAVLDDTVKYLESEKLVISDDTWRLIQAMDRKAGHAK
jgi:nicotinate-nucleotide adenylyltransferase